MWLIWRNECYCSDKPGDPVNLAAVMTSTCGSIRRGRAEGQYLFKLITGGWRGCECAYMFVFAVLFIRACVTTCERIVLQHARGNTQLRCDFARASVWPPTAACSTAYSSASLTFQLEILACTEKHDKTATHLSPRALNVRRLHQGD